MMLDQLHNTARLCSYILFLNYYIEFAQHYIVIVLSIIHAEYCGKSTISHKNNQFFQTTTHQHSSTDINSRIHNN